MSFRAKLFLSFAGAVLLPLAVLLYGVRREMAHRLSAQVKERVTAVASVIRADLAEEAKALGERLDVLGRDVESDNALRLALRTPADRRYLLDYAGPAMRRGGLAFLRVQDSSGRILSSGHFRNEYDRVEPGVVPLLAHSANGSAVVRARTPEGFVVVLARLDSARVSGQRLALIGGVRIDRGFLNRLYRDPDVAVWLRVPGDSTPALGDSVVAVAFTLPFVDAGNEGEASLDSARVVVAQSLEPLARLQRDVNLWFLVIAVIAAAVALGLAGWMSAAIGGPLQALAEKTSQVELDRLDVDFDSDAEDEVGALSRLLGEMTRRLRGSSSKLREAERRATVGDLARQLNHDVKNGLVPVRNVFRHLTQVARDEPAQLPAVLLERQKTIEAGIEYLENLARNYARLSPELARQPCDLNELVTEISSNVPQVRLDLGAAVPSIAADPLVIRRILENLVTNAVESLDAGGGGVTITTRNGDAGSPGLVRLTVADTGRGMTPWELERAFEDFYTTKPGGTGLGLSIVRRLVLDLEGTLRVETEPGTGTRFIIDLPVAS